MAYQCTECKKKYTTALYLQKHIDIDHGGIIKDKRRHWVTPYGFVNFSSPVSYEEACAEALRIKILL